MKRMVLTKFSTSRAPQVREQLVASSQYNGGDDDSLTRDVVQATLLPFSTDKGRSENDSCRGAHPSIDPH